MSDTPFVHLHCHTDYSLLDGACEISRLMHLVKEQKMKVQAQIQGDAVRITGKSKDDLQTAIGILKANAFDFPIQFTNYR